MDPFTVALAVFGVSKLTGASTKNSLRNALLAAGGTQIAGMGGLEGFQAFGSTGNVLAGEGLMAQLGNTAIGSGISSLIGPATTTPVVPPVDPTIAKAGIDASTIVDPSLAGEVLPGSKVLNQGYTAVQPSSLFDRATTFYKSLDPAEKIGLGAAGITLAGSLGGDEEPIKRPPGMSDEDYAKAMEEARTQVKDIGRRAPYTATTSTSPYNYGQGSLYTFNKGGIVSMMPKYSVGGVNYLPSKVTHDENDVHNYVRATGYVEDGSGNGDKDEDTILAQLADGEFVSRSDAVLGAGILEGANPNNYKEMRKKGAAYFYDQQAKLKRIFDLIDASKQTA